MGLEGIVVDVGLKNMFKETRAASCIYLHPVGGVWCNQLGRTLRLSLRYIKTIDVLLITIASMLQGGGSYAARDQVSACKIGLLGGLSKLQGPWSGISTVQL